MSIDTAIDINPLRIRELAEVEGIIAKIRAYEQKKECAAGVAIRQNNHLGASYVLVSEREAEERMRHPGKCEHYVRYFLLLYFEQLKITLMN